MSLPGRRLQNSHVRRRSCSIRASENILEGGLPGPEGLPVSLEKGALLPNTTGSRVSRKDSTSLLQTRHQLFNSSSEVRRPLAQSIHPR